MIETLDIVLDDLFNAMGIYGAHNEDDECLETPCRMCLLSGYESRIREAIKNEEQFKRGQQ